MAFNGKLLEFADPDTIDGTITWDEFDLNYVYKESYVTAPNRRQDLDPYRDANGELHRNTLEHTATTIQFQTKPMWQYDMATVTSFLEDHYVIALEKKVYLRYYSDDTDSYKTGYFYVPDIEFTKNLVDTENCKILYNSTTLEFIEY